MAKKDHVTPEDPSRKYPNGVSGILRCRNCADFLEACIDSCIDGLDELIAVYHDCTDHTDQILLQKKKQYPRKIKVYEYKPYIFPMEMDRDTFLFAKGQLFSPEHFLSGYSNYALSKVTFRYVVKIDADQVYFTPYWKRLCNAYRSTAKNGPNWMERTTFKLYQSYIRHFTAEGIWNRLLRTVATGIYPFYFSYIEKMIRKEKIAVSLSGINLFHLDGQWMVCLGQEGAKELFPLFNGVHDTFFFELSSHTFFEKWSTEGYSPGQYRILEVMRYKGTIWEAGFLWFHLKPVMLAMEDQSQRLYTKYKKRFVPLDLLKEKPYNWFCQHYHPFFTLFEATFSYFYNVQKKRIPWEMLTFLEKQYKKNREMNQHSDRDYYLEYYEELDKRLEQFVLQWARDKQVLLGQHSVKEPLQTFLFYRLTAERKHYNQCRQKGMPVDASMKRVDAFLDIFGKEDHNAAACTSGKVLNKITEHPWYELLNPYQGQLLVYLFNERQLHYLTPLLQKLDGPVLLLSECDLPEETDLPESVMALPLDFSSEKVFNDHTFERTFPLLFHYTNTFDILLQALRPRGVVCLEGCHYQEQLLAVVAESYDIPSYGIQQGWPSMMRTGFRRLPFRYFFTWGKRFSDLWAHYNPHPRFISAGYMYEIVNRPIEKKTCVSFFLQSPCYLSDANYFNSFIMLVFTAAQAFPDVTFLVREHPEYKLDQAIIEKWKEQPNVEIVSDSLLGDVYVRSKIVVSHFSSSLMEGMLYGAIPLVFDPTTHSRYNPDVEKEGIGRIVTSSAEFINCLKELLEDNLQPLPPMELKHWFEATDTDTLENIVNFLKNTWRKD